jgi:AcrR family transcriptional regulator
MPTSLAEDLAWSLVSLASEQPLGTVSFRTLAAHARLAPGTITNHFATKQELLAVCTTVVGRWLAHATFDHVRERGPVGLFPGPDDLTYRWLLAAWVQLEAHALTDRAVDERVRAAGPQLQRSVASALDGPDPDATTLARLCVDGLRRELVRPGADLTPADALAALAPLAGTG